MKKWIISFLAVLLALPVFGSAVFAEEDENSYEIEVEKVTVDGSGGEFSMFFSPAVLKAENEDLFIEFSHGATAHLEEIIEVNGNEAVEKNLTEELNQYKFNVNGDLNQPLKISMLLGYTDDLYTGVISLNEDDVKAALEAIEAKKDDDIEEDQETEQPENKVFTYNYESDKSLNRHFENPVTVIQKDDTNYVQIQGSGAQYVDSLTINGEEVIVGEINEDNTYTIQFELASLSDTVDFSMYLVTPTGEMDQHAKLYLNEDTKQVAENQEYTIYTDSLQFPTIPVPEPKPEPEPGDEDGDLEEGPEILEEAEYVIFHETEDEASIADNYFTNEAKIIEIDGKIYLQLVTTNPEYFEYFKSEQYGDFEIIDESGTFQVEITDDFDLSKEHKLNMHINVDGVYNSKHKARLIFEEADLVEEDEKDDEKNQEPVQKTISLGEEISIHGLESITIKETGDTLTLPSDLPKDAKLKISSVTPDNQGDLEIAGAVYNFEFTGLEGYEGNFTLTMAYDSDEFSANQVDIYYYDESKGEWVAQGGNKVNGEITLKTDHFSTYGVFATEETDPTAVDRAFTIDYTILDKDGNEVSAADQFFEKPATLLEKDGVYYVQIATNANQYIDALSNKYGDLLYVGEDEDGNHIYQFRVVGELTDNQEIYMVITVPGVYDGQEHTTQLVLDTDSMEEVNAENYQLVTSNENSNGPNEDGTQPEGDNKVTPGPKTPSKPELEDPEENGNGTPENNGNGDDLNPKTGEETNIMLYVLLMLASAIPLVIKAKRHFA